MSDDGKDDGVYIDLAVSIYGANEEASEAVAKMVLEGAKMLMVDFKICGADVVVGFLTAAMAILEQHDNEHPLH